MKTLGQEAYEKFNEAMGVSTIMPYEKLRAQLKEAWEKTAEYIKSLGA